MLVPLNKQGNLLLTIGPLVVTPAEHINLLISKSEKVWVLYTYLTALVHRSEINIVML